MALTVTVNEHFNFGSRQAVVASITFDSSYPTNGEALTAAQLHLGRINIVLPESTSDYWFEYDYTNSKLKAFTNAAEAVVYTTATLGTTTTIGVAEVGNGVNLSSVSTRVLVIGE
jgi:hypothetical protein